METTRWTFNQFQEGLHRATYGDGIVTAWDSRPGVIEVDYTMHGALNALRSSSQMHGMENYTVAGFPNGTPHLLISEPVRGMVGMVTPEHAGEAHDIARMLGIKKIALNAHSHGPVEAGYRECLYSPVDACQILYRDVYRIPAMMVAEDGCNVLVFRTSETTNFPIPTDIEKIINEIAAFTNMWIARFEELRAYERTLRIQGQLSPSYRFDRYLEVKLLTAAHKMALYIGEINQDLYRVDLNSR